MLLKSRSNMSSDSIVYSMIARVLPGARRLGDGHRPTAYAPGWSLDGESHFEGGELVTCTLAGVTEEGDYQRAKLKLAPWASEYDGPPLHTGTLTFLTEGGRVIAVVLLGESLPPLPQVLVIPSAFADHSTEAFEVRPDGVPLRVVVSATERPVQQRPAELPDLAPGLYPLWKGERPVGVLCC